MKQLVLIRHGQSLWNAENRFTCWVDSPLSKRGIQEAMKAGKLIKELDVDIQVAFTSFLSRAIDTLNILLKELDKNNAITIRYKAALKDLQSALIAEKKSSIAEL